MGGGRLLLVNTDLLRGGTPTVVRELAVRLRAVGVDVVVACLAGRGPVADELAAAGVEAVPLGAAGARDVAVVGRLGRLVRERRPDTVMSFLMHANAAAAVVAATTAARGVRWVQSIQTTQPDPWWHWPVQRAGAWAADAVVVPSPSAAAVARDWAGVPGERVWVIPNAVDAGGVAAGRGTNVVFLGRLDPVKDVPTLVAAVARLPGVRLDVYGEGPDRPRIVAAVDRCGVADRVVLHGAVSGPAAALAGAGVLVLPSRAEGFGLVLIEAMAAGVPVVATDVPGIRDVVVPGVTGLLVPPADPAALAAAIGRVLGDRAMPARLIAAAAADVARRFSWGAVLPRWRAVLGV